MTAASNSEARKRQAEKNSTVNVWPPETWCAAINPERTHLCDRPRGHDGDHSGAPMPTVTIDEPGARL
ncbi:hypothetical protein GCM10028801_06930 [Nocardioides maradonensis]